MTYAQTLTDLNANVDAPSDFGLPVDPYRNLLPNSNPVEINKTPPLALAQEGPPELKSFEDYKMSRPVGMGSGFTPPSDEELRPKYQKYVDFYNSGAPEFIPPQETPAVPNLSDGIGAQLRQLFQQYMGGRRPRRNYMQPLGYGGGFQGGFGGYGGYQQPYYQPYYQQPYYQQPYYQPPMQQQPYYGGGIMGGNSYGYPNNYSSYQQPYQQPYQMAQQYQSYGGNQQPYGMAQQYQQQPAYQPYSSFQPQYPRQYGSYASPFANSIR